MCVVGRREPVQSGVHDENTSKIGDQESMHTNMETEPNFADNRPIDEVDVRYVRLYADAAGESHFEDVRTLLSQTDFAPPAPPVYLSAFASAQRWAFLRLPAEWASEWHPVPHRQVFFWLAGEIEATVSDGEVRRFPAGTVVLVEDTAGKGHCSRAIGGAVTAAVVQLWVTDGVGR